MKIIITHMMWLVLGIYCCKTNAQITIIPKLAIGEKVPDLPLRELYNYPGKENSLGDFKGKLLILDFWATWCGPCIAAFPKVEALRERFKGEVEILPITIDPLNKVSALFSNLNRENGLNLFSVVNDKEISALFNFKSLPHYVWIDKDGKYIGDSQIDDITEEKFSKALRGVMSLNKEANVIKRHDNSHYLFNFNTPVTVNGVFQEEKISEMQLLSSGVLTRNIKGLTGSQVLRNNRYVAINTSIEKMLGYLYGIAVTGGGGFSNSFYFVVENRIVWDVGDKGLLEFSSKYLNELASKNSPGWRQFFEDHRFSYEFRSVDSIGKARLSKMAINFLNDQLKALYNISSYIEKRKVRCLILKRTSEVDKVASNIGSAPITNERVKANFYSQTVLGKPYRDFIMPLVVLQLPNISTPIIDETGFDLKKNVNIKLEGSMSDWKSINRALAAYDLRFEEEEREIDMIIISDRASIPSTIR